MPTSVCQTLWQNLTTAQGSLIAAYSKLTGLQDQLITLQHTLDQMAISDPRYTTTYQQVQQLRGQIQNAQNEVTMWQGTVDGLKKQLADNNCFAQPATGA